MKMDSRAVIEIGDPDLILGVCPSHFRFWPKVPGESGLVLDHRSSKGRRKVLKASRVSSKL